METSRLVKQNLAQRPAVLGRPPKARAGRRSSSLSAVPLSLAKGLRASSNRSFRLYSAAANEEALSTESNAVESAPGAAERKAQLEAHQLELKDVEVGKIYTGVVRSTASFGAFVDIGAKKDGLVHISQLSDKFVSNVGDVLKAGQEVQVKVIEVDPKKMRMQLSIKEAAAQDASAGLDVPQRQEVRQARRQSTKKPKTKAEIPFKVGDTVKGTVKRTVTYGAFVSLGSDVEGLLHRSDLMLPEDAKPNAPVDTVLQEGAEIEVTVLSVKSGKVALTNKSAEYRAQEESLKKGVAVEVAGSTTALERALRKAGVEAAFPGVAPASEQVGPEAAGES